MQFRNCLKFITQLFYIIYLHYFAFYITLHSTLLCILHCFAFYIALHFILLCIYIALHFTLLCILHSFFCIIPNDPTAVISF